MNDSKENVIERHPGPPLILLAAVHTLLFVCALATRIAAPRWHAFFLFASSVPLGLFAAVAASRLQFLGLRAAGVHIALFGGIAASLALAASGLSAWIAADPGMAGAARAMQQASFAAGGPAFAAGFGLLAAGVSVTAGLTGLLPRWTMWLGLFVGAAGELSTLGLVVPPAMFLIPATRFPGLVWLIAAGALLPAGRRT